MATITETIVILDLSIRCVLQKQNCLMDSKTFQNKTKNSSFTLYV